jgi:4-carboxymuconolactone decarboxylase
MSDRADPLRPADMTPAQRRVYDNIAGGARTRGPQVFALTDDEGRLNGPFNAMLLAPAVGDALQALGAAVRYGSSLSGRVREMAILAVATHWDSAFERYAHEAVARAAGLTDEEITLLRDLHALHPADPHEAAALAVTRHLLIDHDLDDEAFTAARQALRDEELVELTTLVGYYSTLSLLMRVFRVEAPDQV